VEDGEESSVVGNKTGDIMKDHTMEDFYWNLNPKMRDNSTFLFFFKLN
jgi:hypothetical protein